MRNKILEHVLAIIDLSEKEQDEFLSILKEIKIAKKSFLIRPGDAVTEEYFVVKGCLLAYYLDELGNKHILQFAVEDWWISDFESFFNEVPAKLYIEALEDSVLLGIDKQVLESVNNLRKNQTTFSPSAASIGGSSLKHEHGCGLPSSIFPPGYISLGG